MNPKTPKNNSPGFQRKQELTAIAAISRDFYTFAFQYTRVFMKTTSFEIQGHVVDVVHRKIFDGKVIIRNGIIYDILETPLHGNVPYIMPGFIDAHVHVESSMVPPSEFARMAVRHGSVGAICDPHEIGNVLGVAGVKFMINNAKQTKFRFAFGAPSCVPATNFETTGFSISANDVEALFANTEVSFLAEMMNFPGVIHNDREVWKKIRIAQHYGVPIDGHAPALSGKDLETYINAGISTDHECCTIKEAEEKIKSGMHILIREGSAAKNFEALCPLLETHPEKVMFCSDDKHPDDLKKGHINALVKRACNKGYNIFDVLRAANHNPIKHYGLHAGLLQKGDPADFILVDDFTHFSILSTYISGEKVAHDGISLLPHCIPEIKNHFHTRKLTLSDIEVKIPNGPSAPLDHFWLKVLEVKEGELFTKEIHCKPTLQNGKPVSNTESDVLKVVVKNRYNDSAPAVAFVRGFGLRQGAIGCSIAHDSHNLIAVGVSDEDILSVLNAIIDQQGGIATAHGTSLNLFPLPIAGLMSDRTGDDTAAAYEQLNATIMSRGCLLSAPFMTMAFIPLLVIPELKLSDRGLFDGNKFAFTPLLISK